MVRGVYLSQNEAESTTLAGALEHYDREIFSSKKGHLKEKRIRTWKSHPLAKHFLATMHGKDIAIYRDERIKSGVSANTVRLDLAIIFHLFEIARKEWGMEGLTTSRVPAFSKEVLGATLLDQGISGREFGNNHR